MPEQQLEAIPAKKQRQSTKSQTIKSMVIAKTIAGATKTKIANDLGINRNTVRTILNESELQQSMQEVRSAFVIEDKLWKAKEVLCTRLDKGSESAATTILRGFNVLRSGDTHITNIQNNGAMSWTQIIEAKKADSERKQTTISSVSDPSNTTEHP